MKHLVFAALLAFACLDAAAQSGARARPPGTLPLDEVPPPPPIAATQGPESALESQPQVTTTRVEGDQTIQETRVNGKVVMQRITTRAGRTYVLNDNRGDGTFSRQDHPLDQAVRVPQWTLLEF